MTTQQQEEKTYDPKDTTLKFVNRPDDLDPLPPEDGDRCLRAEMSCGHAVTPESLTAWCRSLLDQGQYKFKCPALKDGTLQKCDQVWSYQEVRKLAVLTAEEMQYFEEVLARLAATEYCDFKTMLILFALWLWMMTADELPEQTNRPEDKWLKKINIDVETPLPSCPQTSPHLVGPLLVEFNWSRTMDSVRTDLNSTLLDGGRYKPPNCTSLHKVAIIVPFRNQTEHLIQWLYYMHPILQRQQLDYGVYVINQDGEGTFNRAKLMNVGFLNALKAYNYNCHVFSGVDLIPIDDRNIYGCFSTPRHLSVAIDKFEFKLPSIASFGGVVSMTKEDYVTINGFANEYWGWGAEDDELYQRTVIKSLTISRPDMTTGRFVMIKHETDLHNEPNPKNVDLLSRTSSNMEEDGISSLIYNIKKVEKHMLYTFITVDIGGPK